MTGGMHRRALLCFALPAATVAGGRPARAFREAVATADVARDWATRCRADPVHPGAGPVAICPFCGCPVVGARDHGEAGPLRPD
jgi:hypothetical protein